MRLLKNRHLFTKGKFQCQKIFLRCEEDGSDAGGSSDMLCARWIGICAMALSRRLYGEKRGRATYPYKRKSVARQTLSSPQRDQNTEATQRVFTALYLAARRSAMRL